MHVSTQMKDLPKGMLTSEWAEAQGWSDKQWFSYESGVHEQLFGVEKTREIWAVKDDDKFREKMRVELLRVVGENPDFAQATFAWLQATEPTPEFETADDVCNYAAVVSTEDTYEDWSWLGHAIATAADAQRE